MRIDITSKRKGPALDDLKKAKTILNGKESKMTASCRDAKVCTEIIAKMRDQMTAIEEPMKASQDYMNGSDQEREALDKSYNIQDAMQKDLTRLQEQMVPKGAFFV